MGRLAAFVLRIQLLRGIIYFIYSFCGLIQTLHNVVVGLRNFNIQTKWKKLEAHGEMLLLFSIYSNSYLIKFK